MALMWLDVDSQWAFLDPGLTAEDLAEFVKGDYTAETDAFDRAWAGSLALLQDTLSSAWRACPDDVLINLYLEVGSELYKRQDSPTGSSPYAEFEGSGGPIRSPRDPLTQSWPILRRYVLGF